MQYGLKQFISDEMIAYRFPFFFSFFFQRIYSVHQSNYNAKENEKFKQKQKREKRERECNEQKKEEICNAILLIWKPLDNDKYLYIHTKFVLCFYHV